MHFLDVDKDLARRTLLQIALQLVDFCALAPDNNSRPRRLNDDAQLVARALDLDSAYARRLQLLAQLFFQLDVFEQQLVVITLHKPPRLPRLGIAEAKTIRMDFLSHCFS